MGEIFPNPRSEKRLVLRIYEELIINKDKYPIKKYAKGLDISPK